MKPWIQTFTNLAAWPLSPIPEMISLDDIAHALSQINRFTGHGRQTYSVAEHSVLLSQQVPAQDALAGLMHEAGEAYLGDMATPTKQFAYFKIGENFIPFAEVESWVHLTACSELGIDPDLPPSIKEADVRMMATERRLLLGPPPMTWEIDAEPYPLDIIQCWSSEEAEARFLQRYAELRGQA